MSCPCAADTEMSRPVLFVGPYDGEQRALVDLSSDCLPARISCFKSSFHYQLVKNIHVAGPGLISKVFLDLLKRCRVEKYCYE